MPAQVFHEFPLVRLVGALLRKEFFGMVSSAVASSSSFSPHPLPHLRLACRLNESASSVRKLPGSSGNPDPKKVCTQLVDGKALSAVRRARSFGCEDDLRSPDLDTKTPRSILGRARLESGFVKIDISDHIGTSMFVLCSSA